MTASCLESFVRFDIFSKLQPNGPAFLRYTIIVSVKKLTQVRKSNTKVFLRIERNNRKIVKRILQPWTKYLRQTLVFL